MQHLEPIGGRTVERTVLEPERRFGLRTGENLVRRNVPVPDHIAGAGQRQRAPLDVGNDVARRAAGEGVLHHRKADQHDDENEAAEQSRSDDIVGKKSEHRQRRAYHPDHKQQPGRDQHHRAVVIVRCEIDDERKAEYRNEEQRHARDARGDGRRKQRHRDQRAEKRQPADGDMGVAHMPAVEIEVGEQKNQERRCQDRFARGAPDALGARRHIEDFGPKAEINADIDQHRPAERRRGGEHDAAFDHEQDGQEESQQAGNADDDALIERKRVELVFVGVGLPQIKLRQIVGAQFGHEGNHGAGIERDAVDVGFGAVLPLGRIAR